jgi:molybdopterin/thiamine biosynthesis adenylyltransferase
MGAIKLARLNLNDYFERTKRNHYWVGGSEGQEKILSLKIGIAGLGGMGSNIAEIFARLGVGFLRITDPDTIERTNINRQVIAFEDTVGRKKAEASAIELKKIAKELVLDVSTDGISENNVEKFVDGLDVVINEIDVLHMDKQILLLEAARRKKINVYTTLVVGLGIHFYKYAWDSDYSPRDFLGHILNNPTAENMVDRLGEPLPEYLQGKNLDSFVDQIKNGNVPIFGASTYLGQSLLAIRVFHDLGVISAGKKVPKTPALPKFLVLDPLMLQFKVAEIAKNGKIKIHED